MEISTNEMRFFQDVYFLGLHIKYIDDSTHSPYKFALEFHNNGNLTYLPFTDSKKDILHYARDFIAEHIDEARQSDSAFFILRLNTIKICFVYEQRGKKQLDYYL